nr:hypothetical protein [Tanacetum cinerariifolium]GEX22110.1 hypothetical protein [Tanacetum cinerariifolium]
MDTTIKQQVAMDEALIPSTQRLRIGRSNFKLLSGIQSKESTLQVVYDVLRRYPFFKAFLVTADVQEINMQEFWATSNVHHHSIRFKMDNKKHIVNLKTFLDMLHISPRTPRQSFEELPFEEETLDFIRFLEHSTTIRSLTGININKLYHPWRSFAAVINKCLTGKSSGYDSLRNTKAYKEYYAFATGEVVPKPKASAKRKRSSSDSSTTPPTDAATPRQTVAATPRLTATAKGKQPAKAPKAKSLSALLELGGSGTDEGTDTDAQEKEGDVDEETREEESFDPIPRTPEDSEDDGNDEEDQSLKDGEEVRLTEEEEADELYRDVDINQGRGIQVSQEINDSHLTLTPVNPDGVESIFATASTPMVSFPTPTPTITPSIIATTTTTSQAPIPPTTFPREILQHLLSFGSLFSFDDKLKALEANFSEFSQTNPFAEAVSAIPAYEADKIIFDTYGDCVILKRRRDGDDDDQGKGPSVGSDRGSKRQREGQEPESASAPLEPATTSIGRSTTGSRSRQASASESALAEEPVQTTSQIEDPSHLVFETGQQYPHNLLQPLPLIPDNRGRCVIPFAHFINNDLEYLRGDAANRKYTTSVTKTKAADYEHIKWIEDLVPRTMWIQEPIDYDKHALWGVSYWGCKRQQFYSFVVNQEFARDVYSKRRIIVVIDLKIVEWHYYKHLDWISKKLNLTKPDTYRSNLKQREAYTAYSNPRGLIYQNKKKKNRLMRIDELYKFSDGTLNDVRIALDDHLKGIRMQYLPHTIWRKGDKDRASAMIQAIDKMLKTRRIMRSLEKFVGGWQYEGDFRMLQRTI